MTQAEQERRHQERLALIYKPFPRVRVVESAAKTWAGTIIGDNFFAPVGGKRAKGYTEDESYLRYGRGDADALP
mgnify:CR=1 FL=1